MTLPFDYARCLDPLGCPLASRCARTHPGRPYHQSYTAYPRGEDCHGFIEDRPPQ